MPDVRGVVLLCAAAFVFADCASEDARESLPRKDVAPITTSTASSVAPSSSTSSVDLADVDWEHVDYPISCGDVAAKPLTVVPAVPAAGSKLMVVMVACDAGAGTPPRSVLVFDHVERSLEPHLAQVLSRDDETRVTSTISADGATVIASGGTYSPAAPRCCPDGTFTSRWSWTGTTYEPT
jgi:hypothetical protein